MSAKRAPHAKAFKGVPKKKGSTTKTYSPLFDQRPLGGAERKYFDVNSTLTCPIGSAFTTTPAHLNAITQGASNQSRVGFKAMLKSVYLRCNVLWPGGQATNAPSQVRILCVWDNQSNGAIATRGDVLQDGTTEMSPMLLSNGERFVTVFDQLTDQIASNGQFTVSWKGYKKLSKQMLWNGTASIQTTGTLLLFVAANSDSSDVTVAHFPVVDFYSRVRFQDS